MTIDGGELNGADCVDHQARSMATEAYGKAAEMLRKQERFQADVLQRLDTFERLLRRKLATLPDLVEEELKSNPNLRQPTNSERAQAVESVIQTLLNKWVARLAIGAVGALAVEWIVRYIAGHH